MASSNNSTRYLSVASGHIDSLINYVLDVKPYHTKLSEIVEEFLFEDSVNVKLKEDHQQLVVMGPDFLNKSLNGSLNVWKNIGASRPLESLSAERTIISDGTRRTFPIPTSVIPKLLSLSSQDKLEVGVDEDTQIAGLSRGVYSSRNYTGVGIPRVVLNGAPSAESVDYHVSHGAFSFKTYANSQWKEAAISELSQFARNPGQLYFNNVYERYGSITNITSNKYEEFTLTWIESLGRLKVEGSASGNLGTCLFGQTFSHPSITFTFSETYGDSVGTPPVISNGDKFVLTPREKITVSPTAPEETWTLIKTNPIALVATPTFTRTDSEPAVGVPSINVFTQSLEWTPQSTWTVKFISADEFEVSVVGSVSGYPRTGSGTSYKDEFVHFNLVPPVNGFKPNDTFTFQVKDRKPNYLVYGSVSGWQAPAKIGEWYWNGKIGFKIPTLEYFAVKRSATISVSEDLASWTPVVVTGQELTNISYINNAFLVSGARSIVGQSEDAFNWSDDMTNFVTIDNRLIVVGEDGTIAMTEDGLTWYRIASHTNQDLNGIDVVPTGTASYAATENLVVVVGDNGTILTSLNGYGWTARNSNTSNALNSVTHNENWIVVVGDNGTIIRSQDRINWIPCASPTTKMLNKVKYLNGRFVAVGDGVILRSSDGINWVNCTVDFEVELNDVAYGLNTYVAVGRGSRLFKSFDAITWTSSPSKPYNAIEFGSEEEVFVVVERKVNEVANFTPLRAVHSVASPSVYTSIFRPPVSGNTVVGGTVKNNLKGYKKGFKSDIPWFDEWVGFVIGQSSNVYYPGEQIDIYITTKSSFVAFGNYDELPYESALYDSSVGKIEHPLDLMQEYFPLVHNQGSLIFPSVTNANDGQTIIIDKATTDYIKMRIGDNEIAPPAELAPENGWIPLEFRSSVAFPSMATQVDAYLASDYETKVFSVVQPKISGLPSGATLTFDDTFASTYLPERKTFTFRFGQSDTYGQVLNVKVSENLRVYARVRLNFDDIMLVNISDIPPAGYESITELNFDDIVMVNVDEGGAFSRIGYDDLPFDILGYDTSTYIAPIFGVIEVEGGGYEYTGNPADFVIPATIVDDPAVTVKEKNVEVASTGFVEGLQIVVQGVGSSEGIMSVSVVYDVMTSENVYILEQANEYIVTHNFAGTPTVIITPDDGSPFTVEPTLIHTPVSGAQVASFKFGVPVGTGPFKLTLS